MSAVTDSHLNIDAQMTKLKTQRDELAILLKEAQRLGLTFDIGSAYIRRSYIDKQDELKFRIKVLLDSIEA